MKGIVYGGLLSVVFVLSGCSGSQKEGRDSKEIPVEIVKVARPFRLIQGIMWER